jgi:type II secretory pathway pseudopilin PulG
LIELMIVVAIIAIIAAIAIPNLLSARLNANETAAIATLRNISSAQAQFQATSKADNDNDGTGEFGAFVELSGALEVRANATVGRLNPPVLSGAFRTPNADGFVSRSGYFFAIYLPDSGGLGICPDNSTVGFGTQVAPTVDPDLAETTWCCYAWPVNYGNSGNRTFQVNQTGDVTSSENQANPYSGWGAGATVPPPHAAFINGAGNSITGLTAVGVVGGDTNIWRQVN